MATDISKRLFTVDDYYRMADAGILFQRGESIEPKLLAGCRIPVDVLLP